MSVQYLPAHHRCTTGTLSHSTIRDQAYTDTPALHNQTAGMHRHTAPQWHHRDTLTPHNQKAGIHRRMAIHIHTAGVRRQMALHRRQAYTGYACVRLPPDCGPGYAHAGHGMTQMRLGLRDLMSISPTKVMLLCGVPGAHPSGRSRQLHNR